MGVAPPRPGTPARTRQRSYRQRAFYRHSREGGNPRCPSLGGRESAALATLAACAHSNRPSTCSRATNGGTLYVGVTSNLVQRIWQHREHLVPGFTERHDVTRLVWDEVHADIEAAIQREKRIKKWNRLWKLWLVRERNPDWVDLFEEICR